jgi:DNA-binding transcriptional regulator YiaG
MWRRRNVAGIAVSLAFQLHKNVQRHSRVAFLPSVAVILRCLKQKDALIEQRTLGEQLKKRRLELGFSQRELAGRLGVSAWTVLNWEKGKTQPAAGYIPAIIAFVDCAPYRVICSGIP